MDDENTSKRASHRIRIISGQVNGLLKAVEKDKCCIIDILNQSLSIQKSLKSLDALFLESHIKTCAKENINKTNHNDRANKELLQIYTLAGKK